VEAHRSYERFEAGHRAALGEDGQPLTHHGRNAAMAVAVMAAFLAIATFLSNEAVKEVVTGETHRAATASALESNRLKIDVAEEGATLLRVLGADGAGGRRASAAAAGHEARIQRELAPADGRLSEEMAARQRATDHADTQHVVYELAEVGLEVGIVLASVSIIAGRRWLLGAGGAAASAGVVLILAGLLVV
jgi:uncharacterized protein DUF4337